MTEPRQVECHGMGSSGSLSSSARGARCRGSLTSRRAGAVSSTRIAARLPTSMWSPGHGDLGGADQARGCARRDCQVGIQGVPEVGGVDDAGRLARLLLDEDEVEHPPVADRQEIGEEVESRGRQGVARELHHQVVDRWLGPRRRVMATLLCPAGCTQMPRMCDRTLGRSAAAGRHPAGTRTLGRRGRLTPLGVRSRPPGDGGIIVPVRLRRGGLPLDVEGAAMRTGGPAGGPSGSSAVTSRSSAELARELARREVVDPCGCSRSSRGWPSSSSPSCCATGSCRASRRTSPGGRSCSPWCSARGPWCMQPRHGGRGRAAGLGRGPAAGLRRSGGRGAAGGASCCRASRWTASWTRAPRGGRRGLVGIGASWFSTRRHVAGAGRPAGRVGPAPTRPSSRTRRSTAWCSCSSTGCRSRCSRWRSRPARCRRSPAGCAAARHTLHEWTPKLPATTPASQMGILHGVIDGIPAFRWYDRANDRVLVANKPARRRRDRGDASRPATACSSTAGPASATSSPVTRPTAVADDEPPRARR